MVRWHWPPDTGFEIWDLAVWGWARYLSVTEVPHNIDFLRVSGQETFCFFHNLKGRVGFFQADSCNHCNRSYSLGGTCTLMVTDNIASISFLRKGFRMNIFIALFELYVTITLFYKSSILRHLHPLQVGNFDSNSRIVVNEDLNDYFRLERAKI